MNVRPSDVLAAYERLARKTGDFVKIRLLREQLPLVRREELNRLLIELYREQAVNLVPQSNQMALTPADRHAAVYVGGEYKHRISIEDPDRLRRM